MALVRLRRPARRDVDEEGTDSIDVPAAVVCATRGAEGFFCAMPDGSVSPAFRFAVLAEIFAVGSTAAVVAPLMVLAIPGLWLRFLSSGRTREAVVLATLVGVVGFTV